MLKQILVCTAVIIMLMVNPVIAPAAAQTCPQWKVAGVAWYALQSNGSSTQIVLKQDGTNLTGQGMFCSPDWWPEKGQCGGWNPKVTRGQIDGTIRGNEIQFTVYWSNTSAGVYMGIIGPTGRIDGTTYDKLNPNQKADWHSDDRMECASTADATQTPPAEQKPGKVLGRVPTTDSAPQRSICDAARDARARNSPAAPGLEAQCLASQQPKALGRVPTTSATATQKASLGAALTAQNIAVSPTATATQKAPLAAALTAKPAPTIRASVNLPPPGFIGTLDKTPPNYQPLWIYGIRPNGELIWYRKDSNASVWQGPKTVGTGWNGFKDVIPAGDNRFYALTQDAKLIWYRHDGFNEGSFAWPGPVEVGSGWTFSRIFSGGQGIVYAIKSDGTLLWYRNNDPANGVRSWQEAKVVGSAWNQFKDVFSTGQGAIYAVRSDGRLVLYQHDGYATGEMKWQQDRVVGTGWNSFKQIIPSSEGVIMGILPDGKLVWHKHLGLIAPNRLAKLEETWQGPVQIGSGWQDFGKVIALIPDPSPAAVR